MSNEPQIHLVQATIEAITLSNVLTLDFGVHGDLLITAGFMLIKGGVVKSAPEPDELTDVALEIVRLPKAQISRARILESGELRLDFDIGIELVVSPVDDGEAYRLRQALAPRMIVCGFGGELFVWDE